MSAAIITYWFQWFFKLFFQVLYIDNHVISKQRLFWDFYYVSSMFGWYLLPDKNKKYISKIQFLCEVFCIFFIITILNPHLRILEREKGRVVGERGRERGRSVWARNIYGLPPVRALTQDRTSNWGMCPDQELNP